MIPEFESAKEGCEHRTYLRAGIWVWLGCVLTPNLHQVAGKVCSAGPQLAKFTFKFLRLLWLVIGCCSLTAFIAL